MNFRLGRKALSFLLTVAVPVSAPGPFAGQAFAQAIGRAGTPAGVGTSVILPVAEQSFAPLTAPGLTSAVLPAPFPSPLSSPSLAAPAPAVSVALAARIAAATSEKPVPVLDAAKALGGRLTAVEPGESEDVSAAPAIENFYSGSAAATPAQDVAGKFADPDQGRLTPARTPASFGGPVKQLVEFGGRLYAVVGDEIRTLDSLDGTSAPRVVARLYAGVPPVKFEDKLYISSTRGLLSIDAKGRVEEEDELDQVTSLRVEKGRLAARTEDGMLFHLPEAGSTAPRTAPSWNWQPQYYSRPVRFGGLLLSVAVMAALGAIVGRGIDASLAGTPDILSTFALAVGTLGAGAGAVLGAQALQPRTPVGADSLLLAHLAGWAVGLAGYAQMMWLAVN